LTTFSDDGQYFWDGATWRSAISADKAWRWNGTEWVVNQSPAGTSVSGAQWAVRGTAVLAIVVGLAALLGMVTSIAGGNQTQAASMSALGASLVLLSGAVLLAVPMVVRFARRRNIVGGAIAASALLFLGTCGGGIALDSAFPVASPTPGAGSQDVAQRPSPTSQSSPFLSSPSSPSPSTAPSPSPSPFPSISPSPRPSTVPSPKPSPKPAQKPPAPKPAASTCGAPANPWGYNFCGRGGLLYKPAANFCSYFVPCVSTFWSATSGYVVECHSGKWSHSGGVSGACNSNGGVWRTLDSGP